MKKINNILNIISILIILIVLTFAQVKSEEEVNVNIILEEDFTLLTIAEKNQIPLEKLLKGLGLSSDKAELKLSETGKTTEETGAIIRKIKVLKLSESSKDWKVIFSKFILWFLTVIIATIFLYKKRMTLKVRFFWMAGTAIFFGFIYGGDPNPMGTVKDAIVLYAREKVVFYPRLIACAVFLLMVFFSNKSICSWGCHLGALQDILHFIPVKKKFKLPFWISNGIRIIVFLSFVIILFGWNVDWIGVIDPFKVFNITKFTMTVTWITFLVITLLMSIFFYRPWCQFFCPFGLSGWIVEQFSILKPVINRTGCIKCKTCVKVCPTEAMNGIYHNKKIRGDCFSCGKCINMCPVNVIDWSQ